MILRFILILLVVFLTGLDYQLVAVRAPRKGDEIVTNWQEVIQPTNGEPGTHLVLLKPDGTEEILVSAGDKGVILDPCPSLDGTRVYYSLIADQTNKGKRNAAKSGSDIWVVDVATKGTKRLTNQEWTPNTGVANWSANPLTGNVGETYLGHGIFNLGPCPIPGGRIVFTSSRNGLLAPKSHSYPNLQLFVMDDDGKNVEQVGHLNIGSALHPFLMRSGAIGWSSWEAQGYRDARLWGLWESYPDGRNWGPLMSAFVPVTAMHFSAQKTDGEIITTLYYNMTNNGFGTLLGFRRDAPSLPGIVRFGNPDPQHPSNPVINLTYYDDGRTWPFRFSFSPYALRAWTPSSNIRDRSAPIDPTTGQRLGKYTHPSVAPNNELLAVYSPGPASARSLPTTSPAFQGQVVILQNPVAKPHEHTVVKSDTNFNYQQPKALVPWEALYGIPPVEIPFVPNDGTLHTLLPKGTPFGLIGTSSLYKRESKGMIPGEEWETQGSDSGVYSNSEIHAIRIVQTEPQSHLAVTRLATGTKPHDPGWTNPGKERLRILGEIPVRKPNAPPDPDGNPDTSFLTRIPADVPFTFQTIDADGLVLNMAQSWHQLRPGEIRTDCGGCHSHSQPATDFALTAAAKPDYAIQTLTQARDREFDRDVWPILEAKCQSCHVAGHESGLDLSTSPVAYAGVMKHVKHYRPRESRLMHKLFGRVLDGGGDELLGDRMPPTGDPLTSTELRTIGEWVGLGATRGTGAFTDDLRPTLTVSHPRKDETAEEVIFSAFDTMSGLNLGSLKVTLDGVDITGRFAMNENIWRGTLDEPDKDGELTVSIADKQGNVSKVVRTFKGVTAPPTCEEEVARLKAEVEALKAKVR